MAGLRNQVLIRVAANLAYLDCLVCWYAAVNALFGEWKLFKADYSVIPWATFIDPEVARVGLNEQEAQAQGVAYEVTKYGIDDLDRALKAAGL